MTTAAGKYRPLIAGAIIQLCIGIIYIWSVFRAPVIAYYTPFVGEDTAVTCASLTYSIMLATFVLGIIVGGRLSDKRGPRPVVYMGGLMFFAGIILSAVCVTWAPGAPWLICLFYGGIAGFGVGAAYTSTIGCAQRWFLDRKGFATGIIVCTFGASTVVFTPVVNALLAANGVSMTFLTLSLIFLVVIMICAAFVKNPPKEYTEQFAKAAPALANQAQYTPGEMLRTKSFWLLFVSMLLLLPAYFILNPLFLTLGEARGLSEAAALGSVMVTGIASAAGRLVAPWLSDRMKRKSVIMLLFVIMLASVLLLIFAQGFFYIVLIALVTFAFGGSAGVYPAVTGDYFGAKNVGVNYGLVMVAFAISAIVFPTLATAVNTGGEATALTFIIPAIACVVGMVVTVILRPPAARKH